MSQLLLINAYLVFGMILSTAASSKGPFDCKEVKIQSLSIKVLETNTLCFLKDDTYFITENCALLDCKFMARLKKNNSKHSGSQRPGPTICRAIGGIIEEVALPTSKLRISRCLFPEERSSISLNLLESWNGTHFTGPSKSIDM